MIIIKKLFLLIILLIPIYISSFKKETTFFKPIIVHITDKDLYLDLEDYVLGVVSAEMPVSFEVEALKAQGVASRSYAMVKNKNNVINISSGINDQVYKTNYELYKSWKDKYFDYYEKIKNAVDSTVDEVITRDGQILKTYYFSMSNGYTENSKTVFKEELFQSVESPLETKLDNFIKEKEFSKNELKTIFNSNDIKIGDITRSNTNHVETIIINNKEYTGIEIRKLLKLRSTDFTISEERDKFIFTTKGYGHGVGMSQYGANEMAKEGKDYHQILNHYYQNSTISLISV